MLKRLLVSCALILVVLFTMGIGPMGERDCIVIYLDRPVMPKQFETVDELENWLEDNPLDKFPGIVRSFDCEDFSLLLIKAANRDGYYMSMQIEGNHAINSTVIGNSVYFIEPQTDEYWWARYLD